MSDQEWDVLEFVERIKNGEFDGQLGETIDSLSLEQIEDLDTVLLMQGESRNDNMPRTLFSCGFKSGCSPGP